MLWEKEIPRHALTDSQGRRVEVTTVAGELFGRKPPSPPPSSWAARRDTDVAIWTIKLDAEASFTLPPATHPEAIRTLYFFKGQSLSIGDRSFEQHAAAIVRSSASVALTAGPTPVELLMLQGRPIGEPVAQHGPFVMNSRAEIQQAFADYQRTRFGGWPWPSDDPVHGAEAVRFARHLDGRIEKAE
jgi:redox-sensitive bicupin YhaK (pirin superfamily)